MPSTTPWPEHDVPRALGRLRVALDAAYQRAARAVGLSPQQAELLCASLNPASVNTLAETLRCDRSNISRLVDRASAQGLLERRVDDRDGRVSLITPSPQGHETARTFLRELNRQTEDLLVQWSPSRRQSAIQLLTEITLALETVAPSPRR